MRIFFMNQARFARLSCVLLASMSLSSAILSSRDGNPRLPDSSPELIRGKGPGTSSGPIVTCSSNSASPPNLVADSDCSNYPAGTPCINCPYSYTWNKLGSTGQTPGWSNYEPVDCNYGGKAEIGKCIKSSNGWYCGGPTTVATCTDSHNIRYEGW